METKELIKSVKLLMIETGYDAHGKRTELAKLLKINMVQLSFAMTGVRKTPRSVEILEAVQKFLRRKL